MQDAHEFLITFCDTFEKETTDFRKQIQDSVQQQVTSEKLDFLQIGKLFEIHLNRVLLTFV